MSSRILEKDYPYIEYLHPRKGRCAKMKTLNVWFDVIRFERKQEEIHEHNYRIQPIIAKNNRFDKVTARW